jgi:hypothetical protein
MAGLAVSNVRHRTRIQYIDIRPIPRRYQLVASLTKLPRQKLYLRLIQLAAKAIQSDFGNLHSLPTSFINKINRMIM